MEFCPEIAVLQSAFQLLQQKAGKDLQTLRKDACKDFTPIITTAVQEICTGLESDNDAQQKLLWQQKTHQFIFYALITKKYRNKQETRPGCVPVLTTLDTLTHPLAAFSSSFYFELVKQCTWEHCLIDSLSYLDPGLAVQILNDALEHSQTSLVDDHDTNFMNLILENLISSCLTSHLIPNSLMQTLASDLYKKKKLIWTVYPDEYDAEVNFNSQNSNTDQLLDNQQPILNGTVNEKQSLAVDVVPQQSNTFWGYFLQNYSEFLSIALDHSSKKYTENEMDLCENYGATRYLAQLLFLWHCCYVNEALESQIFDRWFVSNIGKIWKPKEMGKTQETWVLPTSWGFQSVQDAACSLNYHLIDSLIAQLPKDGLLSHIHRCLLAAQRSSIEDNKDNAPVHKEKSPEILIREDTFEIAPGIQIKACVLFRMFYGTLTTNKHRMEAFSFNIEECLSLVERLCSKELLNSQHGVIGAGEDRAGGYGGLKGPHSTTGAEGDCVLLGDSWEADVTLSVVLWRIATGQPQAEACMELLLTEACQAAWLCDSVYTVLEKEGRALLCTPTKVLKLIKIATQIHGNSPRETTQRILQLILAVFAELPFPDQDYIVMKVYRERPTEVDVFEKDGFFMVNQTNVFNKLTAEKDDQVQQEIMQLCLTDPMSVLRQAVEICVRNEEQAISSSKVLHHLAKTCSCRHDMFHHDLSLLALVVQDFLTSTELTDKMQKHLITFLTYVMQMEGGSQALLSPIEFLQTTVLPQTSVATFYSDDTPITAKFSLDLLITSLTASCNKKCDWSKSDIEPMVLVVILAQILQECVALWEEGEDETSVAMETECTLGPARGRLSLGEKLVLREKTSQCLEILCDMLEMGYISAEGHHIAWLLQGTGCLHWSVQYRLLPVLNACGYQQYAVDWRRNFHNQLKMCSTDCLTILLLAVSLDPTLADTISPELQLDYTDVITALIQIWPNLLPEECEHVVTLVESLLLKLQLPLAYRLDMSSLMPLSHWTPEHGSVLGVSQMLRDMVLTLILTGSEDNASTLQMLAHSVQNYVAVIKVRCECIIQPLEGHLFMLSQIFGHICDITHQLPQPLTDITWVLLLNLTAQFTTLCMDCRKTAEFRAQPNGVTGRGQTKDGGIQQVGNSGNQQDVGTENQQVEYAKTLQNEKINVHRNIENSWTEPISHNFSRNRGGLKVLEKLTRNWQISMVTMVERLGNCEEREMILKKLKA